MRHLACSTDGVVRSVEGNTLPSTATEARATRKEGNGTMPYVITQPCIGSKDASCVEVCPVDCIHPTPDEEEFKTTEHLFINPDECIDCGACEAASPSTAISEEPLVPQPRRQSIAI